MKRFRSAFLACGGLAAMCAAQAQASVDEYSVEANSRVTINLELCSAESQLAVRGDSGTDLDFFISSPEGTMVHSDEGIDDYLSYVIEKEGEECATFALGVSNVGDQSNDFTVVLEPISEGSTRVQKYIVQGNATEMVRFKACGTSAQISARGDGDTDLDFIIRNADGAVVHENADTTDETTAELAGLLSDCEVFEMEVANLGEVYNALMVVIEPQGVAPARFAGTAPTTSLAQASVALDSSNRPTTTAETSGPGTYRVDANSILMIDLPVCSASRLEVRGDGDTDLDFTINDADGNVVHSDLDLSDVTFVTLDPGEGCATFAMAVDNLGDAGNDFSVALIDPSTRSGTEGPGEYRINASTATKVALRVCSLTEVTARGDGDTDLDFNVTDSKGESIHSDYDTTDRTKFTLDPGSGCADYQMSVENLGEVHNQLTVAFGDEEARYTVRGSDLSRIAPKSDIAPPGPPIGFRRPPGSAPLTPEQYSQREVSILNRTGEGLSAIYWSNSASVDWGANRLGGSYTLARGQQWNINVADGSAACLFDFRAVTESAREIEVSHINVCEDKDIVIE